MTKKELELRVAELERKQMVNSSRLIPLCSVLFLLGVIVGGAFVHITTPAIPVVNQHTSTLEEQAAAGGAAVPFPSGSSSLPPLNSPPEKLIEEPTDSSSTSTSEESSPSSPQADSGQRTSERFYRLPLRRTR